MPYPSPTERADLLEAISRNSHARRIVTGFCRATPTLAAETTYLDGQLRAIQLDRANLAAVGRATGSSRLKAEGRGDQVKGDTKMAGAEN